MVSHRRNRDARSGTVVFVQVCDEVFILGDSEDNPPHETSLH